MPLDAGGLEAVRPEFPRDVRGAEHDRRVVGQPLGVDRPAMDRQPFQGTPAGVPLAHQQELSLRRFVCKALDLTLAADPGGVDLVEHRLSVAALPALVEPAGAGDQIDRAVGHGDALEIIGDRIRHVRQSKLLDDGPVPHVDLEDDAGFVVVRQ